MQSIRLFAGMLFIMGAQIACQNQFIALGNAKVSIFLALLRKIILLIPLIFILPNYFEDKVNSVFLAEPVADTLATLITLTLFIITLRKLLSSQEQNLQEELQLQ
jgi:Na+-driven multidrug efflux pump